MGGYLGFTASLNTALRGSLGTTLVMQVRAQRPSYWVGETFDTWQDHSSTRVPARGLHAAGPAPNSPFVLPVPLSNVPFGQSDLQTFYVTNPTANLVFHAESQSELWFPAGKAFVDVDGTIACSAPRTGHRFRLHGRLGGQHCDPGPVARRRQSVHAPRPMSSAGRCSSRRPTHPRAGPGAEGHGGQDLDLRQGAVADPLDRQPHPLLGGHPRPSPAGADTVDEFLFGNRVGFCEQISTSLAVMLRFPWHSHHEAVGYVPGGFNPITDLYQVQPSDAHTWVQVWFPGFGWQDFDPTASVPAGSAESGRHRAPRRGCGTAPSPSRFRWPACSVEEGYDGRDRALASHPTPDVGDTGRPRHGAGGPAGRAAAATVRDPRRIRRPTGAR